MRPTVEELLRGTCRVLQNVIEPELNSPYAVEMLHGLIRGLHSLEKNWAQLLPFLDWDNAATAALLRAARARVTPALAVRIDSVLTAASSENLNYVAIENRNHELRALLCEVIVALDGLDDEQAFTARRDIQNHLETRSQRFPLRLIPAMPSAIAAKESAHAHLAG